MACTLLGKFIYRSGEIALYKFNLKTFLLGEILLFKIITARKVSLDLGKISQLYVFLGENWNWYWDFCACVSRQLRWYCEVTENRSTSARKK